MRTPTSFVVLAAPVPDAKAVAAFETAESERTPEQMRMVERALATVETNVSFVGALVEKYGESFKHTRESAAEGSFDLGEWFSHGLDAFGGWFKAQNTQKLYFYLVDDVTGKPRLTASPPAAHPRLPASCPCDLGTSPYDANMLGGAIPSVPQYLLPPPLMQASRWLTRGCIQSSSRDRGLVSSPASLSPPLTSSYLLSPALTSSCLLSPAITFSHQASSCSK